MWGRRRKSDASASEPLSALREAVHQARVEAAERTSVVVDLRDAELARLELLDEVLDPLFAEIPPDVELFDRGVSRGETPRLWIDAVAHVAMGRDKRIYRFLHDTRVGRHVLAESYEIAGYRPGRHHLRRAPPGRAAAGARRGPGIHPARCAQRSRARTPPAALAGARRVPFGFFLGLAALFAAGVLIASRFH